MPVSFDDLTENGHSEGAAWLRLVEEEGGKGIRGALFQTTDTGAPLSFCFTRVGHHDPSGGQEGFITLAKALFQATAPTPTLMLGLTDELQPSVFVDDIRVQLPFCSVKPDAAGPELLWVTAQPNEGSRASRFLDAILERENPLEPFDRANQALAEAFADDHVQALTETPGLATVVSLCSLPERPEYRSSPSLEAQETARTPAQGTRAHLTLAERLWAVLAAPLDLLHYDQDFELDWPGALMPFQRDGVRALLGSDRLLLADDMGLGKTVQVIAALRILHARRQMESCLVVAPASVLVQWRRELVKWAPDLSAIVIQGPASDRSWQWKADKNVTLVSYDTLRSDFRRPRSPARRKTWDVVVSDEAQRIKNRNDTSNALKGLPRVRSWALTGTPIENHEEELASIVEFVDHDRSEAPKRYQPGVELLARHRELQLRRKKSEVLDDLPPKQVTKIAIELNPNQRKSYDKAEREGIVYLKSLGTEVGVRHVLELITRLKQICNADPKTGDSSKLDDIRDRLGQLVAQGHKALVFSQYTSDVSGVAAAANCLREFNPLTLTGDTPQDERVHVIERFKASDDHKVLVLSLRAGGLGLNLQEASYVFHLDRWWNPAVERQAEDRSHRLGQNVKVNAIKYSCVDTIEERIDTILEHKQYLFDELIDDVSLDLSTSREELFGLFGLDGTGQESK